MLFNYVRTESFMDSIDIEDVGNCYIQAFNDEGLEWLMHVQTYLGWTKVKTFGPFVCDTNSMNTSFSYITHELEFKEKKLYKEINEFINNPKRNITQVFLVDEDTYLEKLNNIVV